MSSQAVGAVAALIAALTPAQDLSTAAPEPPFEEICLHVSGEIEAVCLTLFTDEEGFEACIISENIQSETCLYIPYVDDAPD